MKRLWLALFATVPLLLGGVAAAGVQMHGGGGGGWNGNGGWHGRSWHGGGSWHGGHFRDGRFFGGGRFNNFHSRFRVFISAPVFWWGAPYYPYYSPYSYVGGGSYAWPMYGDPGSTTYIQQYSGTRAQSSGGEYSYYCTDPTGYYPHVQNCAKGWLRVMPDDSPTP